VLGLPQAPKTPHILEIKTASDKYFREMEKSGVKKAKPEHWAQMQMYMKWSIDQFKEDGCTRAIYIVVNKDNDLTDHQENSKKVKKVRVKVVNKDSDLTDHPGNTKKVKKVKSKDQDHHVNQENLKMSKTPTQDQAILTEATTRTEVPDAQEVNIVAEEVVSKATKLLEVNPVEEVTEADIVETTKADIVAKTKAGIAATTKADIVAKTQTAAQTSPEMVTIDIQLFGSPC
jgi:hypothetical protein